MNVNSRIFLEVDVQVNCDHFLLVTNCKFNTLALIFASIRCVLFICWSWSSTTWKEVIWTPFNGKLFLGGTINIDTGVAFYELNQKLMVSDSHILLIQRVIWPCFPQWLHLCTLKSNYGMCFIKLFTNFQPGNVSYHVFQSIYTLNFDVPIRSVFF